VPLVVVCCLVTVLVVVVVVALDGIPTYCSTVLVELTSIVLQ
jgi:hypothetical protein